MKNVLIHMILLVGCLLCTMTAGAEVVYLKSGARLEGSIVFQNEEVVVIRDASGTRYQYMMSDVDRILTEEEAPQEEKKETKKSGGKKVTVGVEIAGGAAIIPQNRAGGAVSADLVIGTANMLNRHILLGGSIGYHADIIGGQTYSFLPIQLRAEVPLLDGKHAPLVGAGLGYGIALNKNISGGLAADLNVGWRCQLNSKRAMSLCAFAAFQGATLRLTETIDGTEYTDSNASRTFCQVGIKLGFYL